MILLSASAVCCASKLVCWFPATRAFLRAASPQLRHVAWCVVWIVHSLLGQLQHLAGSPCVLVRMTSPCCVLHGMAFVPRVSSLRRDVRLAVVSVCRLCACACACADVPRELDNQYTPAPLLAAQDIQLQHQCLFAASRPDSALSLPLTARSTFLLFVLVTSPFTILDSL
jgi:hypothetical protein